VGRVQSLALLILDADGAIAFVEDDARREGVQLDAQTIRMRLRDRTQALAYPAALMVIGGERREAGADLIGRDYAPVVWIH
jgi:hypothetical protein